MRALEKAFRSLGYEACPDESLEPSFEKVALYGFGFFYTHAARQLANGKWTSKFGKAEDIEHGFLWGFSCFMRHPLADVAVEPKRL